MKSRNIWLLFGITMLCVVAACSRYSEEERAIRKSAQCYLDAMGDYMLDEAAPYATRYTRENTLPLFKRVMKYTDTAFMNSNRPADIKIQRVRMINDSAAMVYFHKHSPIKDFNDSVVVLLEDGEWLCDVRVKNIAFLPPEDPEEENEDSAQ